MRKLKLLLSGIFLLGITAGCKDYVLIEEDLSVSKEAPFVINAGFDTDSNSRLGFGEDCLSLEWNDGDQLALIETSGNSEPILLTAHLDKPSTVAEFRSEHAVPAGNYFVKYYGRVNHTKLEDWMSFGRDEVDWSCHTFSQSLQDLTEKKNWMHFDILYAPIMEIKEGQVSASIKLKIAFTMLKFNIIGDEQLIDRYGVTIGMLCPTKDFPIYMQLDEKGEKLDKVRTKTSRLELGTRLPASAEKIGKMGCLILPVDMTGHKIYFYVGQYQVPINVPGYERTEEVYEIVKEGKDLKPGVSYTVNLDLTKARKISIENGELSKPEHFRALAYHVLDYGVYNVTQDIDFTGEEFFPMVAGLFESFNGNGHTLSNINIEWPSEGAGLFEYISNYETVRDLNLKNITVNGSTKVGAFCGAGHANTNINNCHLLGTNKITGTGDYVGGIFGGPVDDRDGSNVNGCSVSSSTTVQGVSCVGGIAGKTRSITGSKSEAVVKGVSTVGGIAGIINYEMSNCESFANVTASGDIAGGVVGGYGVWNMSQCDFYGSVTGKDFVGGIAGGGGDASRITECSSLGTVKGESKVGGIAGDGCVVTNCYSLSDITGTNMNTTAGIVGGQIYKHIEKCYFGGTLHGGSRFGISSDGKLYNNVYYNIENCITTAPQLSGNDPQSDAKYVNLKSIKENVGHINADKVYSEETVWENYPNECPKFLRQIKDDGGNGIEAPGFEEDEF